MPFVQLAAKDILLFRPWSYIKSLWTQYLTNGLWVFHQIYS